MRARAHVLGEGGGMDVNESERASLTTHRYAASEGVPAVTSSAPLTMTASRYTLCLHHNPGTVGVGIFTRKDNLS